MVHVTCKIDKSSVCYMHDQITDTKSMNIECATCVTNVTAHCTNKIIILCAVHNDKSKTLHDTREIDKSRVRYISPHLQS